MAVHAFVMSAAPVSNSLNSSFVTSFKCSPSRNTLRHQPQSLSPPSVGMSLSPGLSSFRRALLNVKITTNDDDNTSSSSSTTNVSSSFGRLALCSMRSQSRQALALTARFAKRFHALRTNPKHRNTYLISKTALGFSVALAMFIVTRNTSPITSSSSLLATVPSPAISTSSESLINKLIQLLPSWLTSQVSISPKVQSILKPFTESFGVVFLSEFGDKSMFATALMAMKYNPFLVCLGTLFSLTIMTFIACFLGQLMHYLPSTITHYSSIALFIFFGLQMIIQSRSLPNTPGGKGGERADAEELVAQVNSDGSTTAVSSSGISGLGVLVKVSSLIFVAEWCDRSMLATMALAASSNTVAVIGGATLANIVCTGLAVCAATVVASKISERMVALIAGILFEVFAVFTFLEGPE